MFGDPKMHFESLGTRVTHPDKFRDLKMYFESLGI